MDSNALIRVKTAGEAKLWVPGIGDVDRNHSQIIKRLEAYDERLMLARHEITGDWCVFLKPQANPFDKTKPFPVLGLDRELPTADAVMAKLAKFDAVRNGEKQLDAINREHERANKLVTEAAAEASGIVAEGAESFLHDIGKTNYHRSLRPLKQTGVKGH